MRRGGGGGVRSMLYMGELFAVLSPVRYYFRIIHLKDTFRMLYIGILPCKVGRDFRFQQHISHEVCYRVQRVTDPPLLTTLIFL